MKDPDPAGEVGDSAQPVRVAPATESPLPASPASPAPAATDHEPGATAAGVHAQAHRAPLPGPALALRAVASIVADELAFQRGPDPGLVPADWTPETAPDGPAIRADSLELIGLSARLNQAFHLHESGRDQGLRQAQRLGEWADAVAGSLARPESRVTFLTSGSTGEPRACTHAMDDLQREVVFLARHFAGRRRIVATTPAHHIYGFLFTVLLPAALGVPVLDVRGWTGSEIRRSLAAGDLLVGFPLAWEDLADAAGAGPPADVLGVSSTAPCPPEVLARARTAGFGSITEIYGSSETGGIGLRDDPSAPYELMPHLTADVAASRSMDRLQWIDARRFQVLGRLDPAVQVGGVNVFPGRVAEVLCEHPDVAEAAVRLMRPDEGRRLKAFVVPVPAADPQRLARELDAWLAERLDAPSRPRSLRMGTELPRSTTGKPRDWHAFGPVERLEDAA